MGPGIFAIILLVVAVFALAQAVVVVNQGFEYTLERFGRFTTTLRLASR